METPQVADGKPRLPVTQHLEELRKRLLISAAAVALGMLASFQRVGRIIEWLKRPAGEDLPLLAFFGPAEGALAYLKISAAAGFVLAIPVILHQAWAFVRPALSDRERRFGLCFIGWGSGLFLGGIAFAYGVLLPLSLRFLLGFAGGTLVPVISVSRYLGFVTAVLLAAGFAFEVPLAVLLLARWGVVSPRILRRQWRLAVLGCLLAAALLTPTTDGITLLLLAVPLGVLYGISVLLATLFGRQGDGRHGGSGKGPV